MNTRQNFYVLTAIFAFLLAGCNQSSQKKLLNANTQAVDTVKMQYAKGFKVIKSGKITQLVVENPWQNAKDTRIDYFINEQQSTDTTIQIPVKRVVCFSTTHIAYLSELGVLESVVGVSNGALVSNEKIQQGIANGKVTDVGNENTPNYELILSLKPDIIFAYGVGAEVQAVYQKFAEWDIPVVIVAEYLENSPLGKAEWIKFFSYFFNEQTKADSVFEQIELRYSNAKKMTANVSQKPKVMTGMPWKDTWYVPGGNSVMAKFIEDAGGTYLWNDDESRESLPLSIEDVFFKSKDADIWINLGMANSISDVISTDPRMKELKPLKNKNAYNNNFRLNSGGGNDFWESGCVSPDLILEDLISIFHPELNKDRKSNYYKKLN